MYVCIEVALCGVPMGLGVQLGLGKGPIKIGSNVPTLRVSSVPYFARWVILAHCVCAFCSQLYSGQLRVLDYVLSLMCFWDCDTLNT